MKPKVPDQRAADRIRRDIDWAKHLRSEWPLHWSTADEDRLSLLEDELIDAVMAERAKA